MKEIIYHQPHSFLIILMSIHILMKSNYFNKHVSTVTIAKVSSLYAKKFKFPQSRVENSSRLVPRPSKNGIRKNTAWGYETIGIRNLVRFRRICWSKDKRKSQVQNHQIFVESEILLEWEDAESEALCQGLLRKVVSLADRALHHVLRLDFAMLQEPAEHGNA